MPTSINETIHIDLFGPLPVTNRGKRYIVDSLDQFSKKICLKSASDRKDSTITRIVKRTIAQDFENCKCIVTDNAKEFHSRV